MPWLMPGPWPLVVQGPMRPFLIIKVQEGTNASPGLSWSAGHAEDAGTHGAIPSSPRYCPVTLM